MLDCLIGHLAQTLTDQVTVHGDARYDLSSLELIVSGGAPLGADLQRAVAARIPSAAVGQGWRLTETSIGVTLPDRRSGTLPGSVGRVMPNTELRVVDPRTGRDLGAGEPGELWARVRR